MFGISFNCLVMHWDSISMLCAKSWLCPDQVGYLSYEAELFRHFPALLFASVSFPTHCVLWQHITDPVHKKLILACIWKVSKLNRVKSIPCGRPSAITDLGSFNPVIPHIFLRCLCRSRVSRSPGYDRSWVRPFYLPLGQ